MRLILLSVMLISLGTGLACNNAGKPAIVKTEPAKAESPAHADEAPRISLEDAKKEFDAGTATFVDTRDVSSYQMSHIKGAINIPLFNIEQRWKEIPTDKKIIAYCS
jgi:hypothetical protein